MNALPSELELSVVMPAYKEAEALAILLPRLKETVAAFGFPFEIVVVDAEEAIDNTEEVCKTHGVIHIWRHGGSKYGDAVRSGIAQAKGRFIFFMDADGSHNPSYLPALWNERDRYDVVIGSRYVSGGGTENPRILIFMSYIVNVVFRLVLRLNCQDVSNSLRLYRREHLQTLRLSSHNFDIVEEIIVRLCNGPLRCTVTEVPVIFERRKAGESKRNLLIFAVGYVFTLIRLLRFKIAAKWQQK
jgi:dolichol-phosphate mannosyltransferase